MSAPRLLIDLEKLHHNALTLVQRLAVDSISVTGVTKAALGAPEIGKVLLRAGVESLAGSRIENLESMCRGGVPASRTLIRSPVLSQVDRVVAHADVSFNTELDTISALSLAADRAGRTHGIILMVELGDLREGIMPNDLEAAARQVLHLPNIALKGIGTNLACRSGVSPDTNNMAVLSSLADSIEASCGTMLDIVSGGNSANIQWALSGTDTGRINNLRLGESILLGREPLQRQAIDGLHTDGITLVAEVIETKVKPSHPWGEIAQAAFGEPLPSIDRGDIRQTIFAIGHQDTDHCGLLAPQGIKILGASSDHLIVDSSRYHENLTVGSEVTFGLNYSALLRAMTSPFVAKVMMKSSTPRLPAETVQSCRA